MKFRIEKCTHEDKITYQPQIFLQHPEQSVISMWVNLVRHDSEIKTGAVIQNNPNSITLNGAYQNWDSIPQAKSIIDIYKKQEQKEQKQPPVYEYIEVE